MPRPRLEVADIFRAHGPAYRRDHAGHLNLPQLKVMSAIEACRTPSGFHRIRHTGFLANGIRRDRIAEIRRLLNTEPKPGQTPVEGESDNPAGLDAHQPCPKCGGAMIVIETFTRGQTPRSRAPPRENAA